MPKYVIRNKFYGKALLGRAIEYRGFRKKPPMLKGKGQGFTGCKHILQLIDRNFKKATLVITPNKDAVIKKGPVHEIMLSEKTLRRLSSISLSRRKEIMEEAAAEVITHALPGEFGKTKRVVKYQRGLLSGLLTDDLDPRQLSAPDVAALTRYAGIVAANPKAGGFDEVSTVGRRRDIQLLHLTRLIAEFEDRLTKNHSENDWQEYFREKILFFQDNYIRRIEKPNITTITTQFPDFGVVTADDYLDLLDIKLPKTTLLVEDPSHHSFYWSAPISQAIAQVETYIESVTSRKADLMLQIEKITGIRLKIVKPRGLVIAGTTEQFAGNATKADYLRLLNEGLKNIEIVPYDELSRRLRNTLVSLERLTQIASAGAKSFSKGKNMPRGINAG